MLTNILFRLCYHCIPTPNTSFDYVISRICSIKNYLTLLVSRDAPNPIPELDLDLTGIGFGAYLFANRE
jgi:hypothetical protein